MLGAHLAENSTPLWSHHFIFGSDETWLPERSAGLCECSGAAGSLTRNAAMQKAAPRSKTKTRPELLPAALDFRFL